MKLKTRLTDILSLRQKAEEETLSLSALLMKAEKAVSTIIHGEHAQAKAGPGERFWQYREYVPQDRPQDIDWRQSAKGERVFIRQKEQQTAQKTVFWCAEYDGMNYASDLSLPTKREAAKVIALSLGKLLARAGEQVGLLWRKKSGNSELALERLASGLIEQGFSGTLPDFNATPPPKNAHVFLIGDFLEPFEELKECFKSLTSHTSSAAIIQVLDPREVDLAFDGRAIFEDTSGQNFEHIPNVPSIRSAYQERIKNHTHEIEQFCRRYGWTYYLHVTDQPISESLADLWISLHRPDATLGQRV